MECMECFFKRQRAPVLQHFPPRFVAMVYIEKLAWDPSVYTNTPAVFGEKKTPDPSVPIASGNPPFGFALRVIVEQEPPAKRMKYARIVVRSCLYALVFVARTY